MKTTRSEELFARARQALVGGVNSPVRAFKSVGMNPLFIERAAGSRIYDADGNGYIDYVGSWEPMILGHAHPQVVEAVTAAARKGTSFGAPTEAEIGLAEKIKEAVPSVELLRFCNSGNEATQGALRAARAFTGREKVVKFDGCYHGSVDALLVKAGSGATTLGVADSAGVPAGAVATTLTAEFNNLLSVLDRVEESPGEIAVVLLEVIPGNMGVIAPDLAFLQGLRSLCDREGIILIFDEVMTGFRVAWGGAQSLFEITPDLSTFGKVIGGGFPVGAYGGKAEIMEQVAPLGAAYQAGTLSGNPVAMAAGVATLAVLAEENCFPDLVEKSGALMEAFGDAAREAGVPLVTTHFGGMMGFFFSEKPVRNYREALEVDNRLFPKFFQGLLEQGVYIAPSPYEALFVSTVHREEDLEKTAAAVRRALANL